MDNFYMHRWGTAPRQTGQSWAEFLDLGLTLDQDEDTLLHVFPEKPHLSHVALKVQGEGDGQWLACFDKTTIHVAWLGGMPAFIAQANSSFASDRARGARANLKAGRFVVESEKIVQYPPKDEEK